MWKIKTVQMDELIGDGSSSDSWSSKNHEVLHVADVRHIAVRSRHSLSGERHGTYGVKVQATLAAGAE